MLRNLINILSLGAIVCACVGVLCVSAWEGIDPPTQPMLSLSIACPKLHSPLRIERELIQPLMQALHRLAEIRTARAQSWLGHAVIDVWLYDGVSISYARNQLFQIFEQHRLDSECIGEIDEMVSKIPVVRYALTSKSFGTTPDLLAVQNQLLTPALLAIPSVASIHFDGENKNQVHVVLDSQRLRTKGVRHADVLAALKETVAARNSDGESILSEETTDPAPDVAKILGQQRLRSVSAGIVTLADVAKVIPQTERRVATNDGSISRALLVTVYKHHDRSTLATALSVKAAIDRLMPLLPPQVTVSLLDEPQRIAKSELVYFFVASLGCVFLIAAIASRSSARHFLYRCCFIWLSAAVIALAWLSFVGRSLSCLSLLGSSAVFNLGMAFEFAFFHFGYENFKKINIRKGMILFCSLGGLVFLIFILGNVAARTIWQSLVESMMATVILAVLFRYIYRDFVTPISPVSDCAPSVAARVFILGKKWSLWCIILIIISTMIAAFTLPRRPYFDVQDDHFVISQMVTKGMNVPLVLAQTTRVIAENEGVKEAFTYVAQKNNSWAFLDQAPSEIQSWIHLNPSPLLTIFSLRAMRNYLSHFSCEFADDVREHFVRSGIKGVWRSVFVHTASFSSEQPYAELGLDMLGDNLMLLTATAFHLKESIRAIEGVREVEILPSTEGAQTQIRIKPEVATHVGVSLSDVQLVSSLALNDMEPLIIHQKNRDIGLHLSLDSIDSLPPEKAIRTALSVSRVGASGSALELGDVASVDSLGPPLRIQDVDGHFAVSLAIDCDPNRNDCDLIARRVEEVVFFERVNGVLKTLPQLNIHWHRPQPWMSLPISGWRRQVCELALAGLVLLFFILLHQVGFLGALGMLLGASSSIWWAIWLNVGSNAASCLAITFAMVAVVSVFYFCKNSSTTTAEEWKRIDRGLRSLSSTLVVTLVPWLLLSGFYRSYVIAFYVVLVCGIVCGVWLTRFLTLSFHISTPKN